MKTKERWYTREETAKMLGVSESTIKTEALVCDLPDRYELMPSKKKNGRPRRDRKVYSLEEIRKIAKSRAKRNLRVPAAYLK